MPAATDVYKRNLGILDKIQSFLGFSKLEPADSTRSDIWELEPGQALDNRFRILAEIGRGGMAVVYRAEDELLQRQVALKVLNREFASDAKQLERFRREANACSKLTHPNIVSIHLSGVDKYGRPYIVMELLEARTLEQIFDAKEKIGRDFFADIFLPVIDALAYAHSQHIIHRDLKPANIIVGQSSNFAVQVKILDFGIAKILLAEEESASATVGILGSPLYMSPEQVLGGKADPRSDIYSLACVMYHALTGRPPFDAITPAETMYEHLRSSVPKILEISGSQKISVELVEAIIRALSKDPAKRFQSMDQFCDALNQALHSTQRFQQKTWLSALHIVLIALVAIGLIGVFLMEIQRTKKSAAPVKPPKRQSVSGISVIAMVKEAEQLSTHGDFAKSIPLFQKSLSIAVRDDKKDLEREIRVALASVFVQCHRENEAMEQYRCMINMVPQADAEYRLSGALYWAQTLQDLHRNAEAENICRKYISAAEHVLNGNPNLQLANLQLQLAFLMKIRGCAASDVLGLCQRALKNYDSSRNQRIEIPAVRGTWLAYDQYMRLGDTKQAERELNILSHEILTSNDDVSCCKLYGELAEERGLYERARVMYKLALTKSRQVNPKITVDFEPYCIESLKRIDKKMQSTSK